MPRTTTDHSLIVTREPVRKSPAKTARDTPKPPRPLPSLQQEDTYQGLIQRAFAEIRALRMTCSILRREVLTLAARVAALEKRL